ncbi:glycoside hydrolase family 13 protein, partial [[Mycoplasma] testudinis]|uniref:glycoside hydrolase family 13 protein n=1 Tax=[Mycoplasma] testudinis TaxID=33924 RepID=UPI00056774EC
MFIKNDFVFHNPYWKTAYQINEDTLGLIVQIRKDIKLKKVLLHYGDPYTVLRSDSPWVKKNEKIGNMQVWEHSFNQQMEFFVSDGVFDYYRANTTIKTKRLHYFFELQVGKKSLYLTRFNLYDEWPKNIHDECYTWAYLTKGNLKTIPDWLPNTVWYQIFVDRFFKTGKKKRKPLDLWGKEPGRLNYFGGDLKGIIKKLDYLKNLGITGLYLTPIFKAESNHKYDTTDYLSIEPDFGDEKVLKQLIDSAHQKGIRVMLDAVFNHSGWFFQPWQDVIKNLDKSKYKNWFYINNFNQLKKLRSSIDLTDEKNFNFNYYPYETFAFAAYMPRLNWMNPGVQEYLKKVVTKWTKLGIDGWRLDVANEPAFEFWRNFRRWAKEINPNIYILGEIWYDSTPWISGDMFDGVMNYPLRGLIIDAALHPNKKFFETNFSKFLLSYNAYDATGMFNILSSHDVPRLLTILKGNEHKFLFAYQLLFLFSGSPCIFYGDEIGLDGDQDPGCRKCMIWDSKEQNQNLLSEIKNLIAQRKKNDIFAKGEWTLEKTSDFHSTSLVKKYKNKKINVKIDWTNLKIKLT